MKALAVFICIACGHREEQPAVALAVAHRCPKKRRVVEMRREAA